jgi:hypothetical protein
VTVDGGGGGGQSKWCKGKVGIPNGNQKENRIKQKENYRKAQDREKFIRFS